MHILVFRIRVGSKKGNSGVLKDNAHHTTNGFSDDHTQGPKGSAVFPHWTHCCSGLLNLHRLPVMHPLGSPEIPETHSAG